MTGAEVNPASRLKYHNTHKIHAKTWNSILQQISAFAVGAIAMASLIANPTTAQETNWVHIPDQTIGIRTWEKPNLAGTIQDGEYAGVEFLAVPDAAIPLPPDYRPENLLKNLDPSLKVEGIGMPPADSPIDKREVTSALANTAFRLKMLVARDGQKAIMLNQTPIAVYVTGYKTASSNPPMTLEDVLNIRSLDETHVYINAYVVRISDLPPCDTYQLCAVSK